MVLTQNLAATLEKSRVAAGFSYPLQLSIFAARPRFCGILVSKYGFGQRTSAQGLGQGFAPARVGSLRAGGVDGNAGSMEFPRTQSSPLCSSVGHPVAGIHLRKTSRNPGISDRGGNLRLFAVPTGRQLPSCRPGRPLRSGLDAACGCHTLISPAAHTGRSQ